MSAGTRGCHLCRGMTTGFPDLLFPDATPCGARPQPHWADPRNLGRPGNFTPPGGPGLEDAPPTVSRPCWLTLWARTPTPPNVEECSSSLDKCRGQNTARPYTSNDLAAGNGPKPVPAAGRQGGGRCGQLPTPAPPPPFLLLAQRCYGDSSIETPRRKHLRPQNAPTESPWAEQPCNPRRQK